MAAALYDYFGSSQVEVRNDKWRIIALLFTVLTIITVIF